MPYQAPSEHTLVTCSRQALLISSKILLSEWGWWWYRTFNSFQLTVQEPHVLGMSMNLVQCNMKTHIKFCDVVCVFTYMVLKLEIFRWQHVSLSKFGYACEFVTLLEFEKLDWPTNGNGPPGAPRVCFRKKGINIYYVINIYYLHYLVSFFYQEGKIEESLHCIKYLHFNLDI